MKWKVSTSIHPESKREKFDRIDGAEYLLSRACLLYPVNSYSTNILNPKEMKREKINAQANTRTHIRQLLQTRISQSVYLFECNRLWKQSR